MVNYSLQMQDMLIGFKAYLRFLISATRNR